MQEIYMNTGVGFIAILGVLLAHAYVLIRFGISPAWVVSLTMAFGALTANHAEIEKEVEVRPEPAKPAEVKPAAPDAPALPPLPALPPTPAPQPQR